EEFGYDSKVMWLPDVFGYSWALPQIMKKSGVDYFMTTKISWNTYNEIPFDVFNWRGVDGTEILTSFITTGVEEYYFYTYNGPLEPETVQTAWTNYKGKNRTDEVMMSFGYGDGGGGPAEEQMETAKRLKNFPGLPDSRMGRVDEFFERLDTQEGRTHVWNGELYFELHRGTYTTQAETKWFNRKCEIALHNAELLASQAWLQGKAYPHKTINDSWRRVLTNQFHDILPGSSIKMVYDDTRRDYTESLNEAEAVQEKALSTLLKAYKTDEIVVFNTLSWSRNDVAHLPKLSGSLWDGEDACPTQTVKDINGKSETLAYVSDIPSHGQKSLRLDKSKKSLKSELKVSETSLENRFYKISLDANGEIRSLKDKRAKREVLEKGARGNQLQIFEDLPLQNDAWDIDIFYVDKMQPVKALDSIKVIETGPVRAGVEITRSFGRSKLRQRMFIYADIARIDFETDVDWQESKRMLKVAFPVDIHSDFASYEIQFGAIRRPTHWNTSWDWAKFEVCAQRWADLSEGDYGVSLLNESKYGYDIKDNILRHTLLRSPSAPDRRADLGRQVFTYSLYPHQDDWARAETVQRAAELNVPLISGTGSGKAANSQSSFVSIDKEHVIIDTVKKAEDRDELVVRLYESANRRGKITLSFDRPVKKAFSLNMMEEIEGPLKVSGNKITLDITPYEVVTIGVKV
ncbi:MAG: alpha-mannosidase, partial [Lentisphaeria bacterium]|nr:alpha-mannosidase [Lentisphaeria bacterium]